MNKFTLMTTLISSIYSMLNLYMKKINMTREKMFKHDHACSYMIMFEGLNTSGLSMHGHVCSCLSKHKQTWSCLKH